MIRNDSLSILNTIAGKPPKTGPSARQQEIAHQNEQAETKALSLSHLTSDVRYQAILDDVLPTMDDAEARWNLQSKYHPTGNLKEETIDNIDLDLKTKGTKQEEYFYYQDNFLRWPEEIQDLYRERAETTLAYIPKQDLQDSTILSIKNTRAIVAKALEDMELSGVQSLETVVEGFRKAVEYGYNQGISTDDSGQVMVVKDGIRVPVNTLSPEENPSSVFVQQIMRAYVTDAIREEVLPDWENARNKVRDDIRLKDKSLYYALGTPEGKDLKKFAMQIIATSAEYEHDKMGTALEGIQKLMDEELEEQMYKNPFEYLAGKLQKADEMQTLLEKRNHHA
jgi:hypothetical protein